jgi:hypothetical protein
MARTIDNGPGMAETQPRYLCPGLGFFFERVTGIEPALSAWEEHQPSLSGVLSWRAARP